MYVEDMLAVKDNLSERIQVRSTFQLACSYLGSSISCKQRKMTSLASSCRSSRLTGGRRCRESFKNLGVYKNQVIFFLLLESRNWGDAAFTKLEIQYLKREDTVVEVVKMR
eukprot:TRINITY_DN3567_c0_g1_i7.p4 TRINITY_DN3567_c0_g1~~TRINITY_DN3567_c0_g1_i7.p4  ORF type:complete len:111 (+),score=0.91 TRINITY_DN3567_c0_g1_i7:1526-1858(+)